LNLVNREDFRAGVNLSARAVRELTLRGVCLSCGVGRDGLEVKFTTVGSDLVTRRERREGVLSGSDDDADDACGGGLLVVVLGATAGVEGVLFDDGGVSPLVVPSVKLELIDAPMVALLPSLMTCSLFEIDYTTTFNICSYTPNRLYKLN